MAKNDSKRANEKKGNQKPFDDHYSSTELANDDFILFFSIFSAAQSWRRPCGRPALHEIAKQATICSSFMIAKRQSTESCPSIHRYGSQCTLLCSSHFIFAYSEAWRSASTISHTLCGCGIRRALTSNVKCLFCFAPLSLSLCLCAEAFVIST